MADFDPRPGPIGKMMGRPEPIEFDLSSLETMVSLFERIDRLKHDDVREAAVKSAMMITHPALWCPPQVEDGPAE